MFVHRWVNRERFAAATSYRAMMGNPQAGGGHPELPAPVVVADADGRPLVMRYRITQIPTGVSLELADDAGGYSLTVLADRDADLSRMAEVLRAEAKARLGRRYLEPRADGAGWVTVGSEVVGRLAFDQHGAPYRAVVDGRSLSWQELGRALEPFEGWRFRLVIESDVIDMRSADGGACRSAGTANTGDHPM